MKSPIPPQIKNPKYLKYRKKETCKICNKTLLLLPHIKTVHKIFSREEYDKRTAHLREDKIGSTVKRTSVPNRCMSQTKDSEICPQQDSANESRRRKTLHEAMLQIEKRYGRTVKRKSLSATVKNKQKIQQEQPSEYCLEEKIRYYVHKIKSWYQVIAIGQSMEDKRHKDGLSAAKFLQITCMNDFTLEQILEVMSLLPHVCPYYRFSAYYEYAKFRCVCSFKEFCTPVDTDLRLFCKGTCDSSLNCKACKSFPRVNIHHCIDWYHCKVCEKEYEYTEKMRATNWKGY